MFALGTVLGEPGSPSGVFGLPSSKKHSLTTVDFKEFVLVLTVHKPCGLQVFFF